LTGRDLHSWVGGTCWASHASNAGVAFRVVERVLPVPVACLGLGEGEVEAGKKKVDVLEQPSNSYLVPSHVLVL
jgi:hypothetical protein